jgi:hypothetical protein
MGHIAAHTTSPPQPELALTHSYPQEPPPSLFLLRLSLSLPLHDRVAPAMALGHRIWCRASCGAKEIGPARTGASSSSLSWHLGSSHPAPSHTLQHCRRRGGSTHCALPLRSTGPCPLELLLLSPSSTLSKSESM